MSTSFFIEFRLRGFAKNYAKWVDFRVRREARRLKLTNLKKSKFVPHITLFGPARTNNIQRVKNTVEATCSNYTLVPFTLGGFDSFYNPDANWLYLCVYTSPTLEQLRYDLAQYLIGKEKMTSNTCQAWDKTTKYKFHSALGKYSPKQQTKFDKLQKFAEAQCTLEKYKQRESNVFGLFFIYIYRYFFDKGEENPKINQYLLRVSVIGKRGHIQNEYDLILKKLLSRREALSRYWWRKTKEKTKYLTS